MAKWLQKRLKQLKLTHAEFVKRLAEQGIERSRVTVTNWVNGETVNLLANPHDAKRLAMALEWSLMDLFLAAGYEISEPAVSIPSEFVKHIKFYHKLSKQQKERYLESISFVTKTLRSVINLDDDFDDSEDED